MKNGTSMNVAFALSDFGLSDDGSEAELGALGFAMSIVFGSFEGGTFNWDRLEWEKRDG